MKTTKITIILIEHLTQIHIHPTFKALNQDVHQGVHQEKLDEWIKEQIRKKHVTYNIGSLRNFKK